MIKEVWLFSYGTLRDLAVQRALFGHAIASAPDALGGYVMGTVRIADDAAVATSGLAEHVILHLTGDPADIVTGSALRLTPAELAIADTYETDAYRRVEVVLASGRQAYVYVAACQRVRTKGAPVGR